MQLFSFFSKITKDKIPFIVGGGVVGLLILWGMGKILTPWVSPVIRQGCMVYLEMNSDSQDGVTERLVNVEGAYVTTAPMTKRISTIGKLRANEEVMLRSEMGGRITQINFKEGEAVEKGEVLIQFDDGDMAAEVTLAEAELDLRQADFDRIEKLRNQNIESIKKFDEVKANLAIAEAKLEKAKSQLDRTKTISPFSGTIGLINISVGAYVQLGQELVKLVDNSPIKIDFKVPEKNVHDVGVGQTVEMTLDGFPDEIFIATVDSVDASLDVVSHSLSLRASVPNEEGRLRAGMFAGISLIIGEKGNSIAIPESAITRDGDKEFVWIVQGEKAGRRRVITGTREKGNVEIIQGLRVDELIVTAGHVKLGEGVKVRVTNLEKMLESEGKPLLNEGGSQETSVINESGHPSNTTTHLLTEAQPTSEEVSSASLQGNQESPPPSAPLETSSSKGEETLEPEKDSGVLSFIKNMFSGQKK